MIKRTSRPKDSAQELYLCSIFVAARHEAGLDIKEASDLLNIYGYPTAMGSKLPSPEQMRGREMCATLEKVAPTVMGRKGFGDVLRAYENDRDFSALFDPNFVNELAMISTIRENTIKQTAVTRALRVVNYCGLDPRANVKPASKRNPAPVKKRVLDCIPVPIKSDSVYETLAMESFWLCGSENRRYWRSLNKTECARYVHKEAEKLKKMSGPYVQNLWENCACEVAKALKKDGDALPLKTLKAALKAEGIDPHKDDNALPQTPLLARAFNLMRYEPQ